jgi:hypothetical protein
MPPARQQESALSAIPFIESITSALTSDLGIAAVNAMAPFLVPLTLSVHSNIDMFVGPGNSLQEFELLESEYRV